YTRLWIGLTCVLVASFAVLGSFGRDIARQVPPVPARVLTTDGVVVWTGQDISDGQNVWQSLGGQGVGSIWGHGADVAPGWSADWLHREASWLLEHWAVAAYGVPYAQVDEARQAIMQRSLAMIQRSLRWLRVIGDTIFVLGTLALDWPKPNTDTGGEFLKPMFCVGKDDVKSRRLRPPSQFATSINLLARQ